MIVDLNLQGKDVWVLGGNKECEMKAEKLLDAGAKVSVLSHSFTSGIRKLNELGKLSIHQSILDNKIFRNKRPYAVVICTSKPKLDITLHDSARSVGALVCVVDTPHLNDFNMSAIVKVGDIRIGISTGGLSPAMASLLRRRIEKVITIEDVLQVKLQAFARKKMKNLIGSPALRKKVVYQIASDKYVKSLLENQQLEQAKEQAGKIIQSNLK
ncbi:MAG: bifunctional precorrin-2 dehydrogenase/sirohydrochlorin ferrochelatase [Thaumarchaeota archaeon]|nr:bifunctional precorrin-2 dehydrogenase/sirohydrochlorin ferrochelatase [Nitrososphaerota archaeon]